MHNLYANFVKILEICKDFSKDLVNERGNLPRRGVVPRFSDLEVISLSLTAEYMSIDSENLLFDRLKDYSSAPAMDNVERKFPQIIRKLQQILYLR